MRKASEFKIDNASQLFLIGFLVYALGSLLSGLFEGDAAIYVGYAVPQAVFIAAVLIYSKVKGYEINDIVPYKKKISPVTLVLAVAVTIGMFMQNLFLSVGFSWIMEAAGVKMTVSMPSTDTAGGMMLALLFLAVFPAFGEEIMYRGALVSGFKERGARFAILMSALVFCMSHLNPAQLIHQFLLGAVLAFIVVKSDSVVYGVIIHFINNLLAVVLPATIPEFNALGIFNTQNALILAAISVVGAAILYPSLYFMVKSCKTAGSNNIFKVIFGKKPKTEGDGTNDKPKRELSYWLIALITVLALLLVVATLMLADVIGG